MADARQDFTARLTPSRASRGKPRVYLAPATTTSTLPPAPSTTARPKPKVVYRAASAPAPAAQPKPKTAAKPAPASPKPAASSPAPASTPTRAMPSGGSNTQSQEGKASWYEAKYHESNPWICAHKTIPKGTVVTVTNLNNGATINCEVGDRGPYAEGRILDLSKYAFSRLASTSSGVIPVRITW